MASEAGNLDLNLADVDSALDMECGTECGTECAESESDFEPDPVIDPDDVDPVSSTGECARALLCASASKLPEAQCRRLRMQLSVDIACIHQE